MNPPTPIARDFLSILSNRVFPQPARQEDDQLFIDESARSQATEQRQLIAKVNRINPMVNMAGATSGLMILVMVGWFVYNALNSVRPIN